MPPRTLGLLIAVTLSAQSGADRDRPGPWKRHVMTPKASWFDSPPSFPRAHFTRYPALLVDDFCYQCSPQKKLAEAMAATEPKAEDHKIGTIRGLEIYHVFYRFKSEGAVDEKSILIKTARNSYREIYHCEPTQIDAEALPSVILRMGDSLVLNRRYFGGGNKGGYGDDFYWFGPEGPNSLDFQPVLKAAQAALPEGVRIWPSGNLNSPKTLSEMKFNLWVWGKGDARCCGPGTVEVSFKLDRGTVIVTHVQYKPGEQE